MKFKLISSALVLAAIFAAVILSGGLNIGSTTPSRTNNDGIRINP